MIFLLVWMLLACLVAFVSDVAAFWMLGLATIGVTLVAQLGKERE